MKWLVTGDTHGAVVSRLAAIGTTDYAPEDTAVIILGDAGINFYLNKTDMKNKKAINAMGFLVYCVRGNHEERPENISTMETLFDENVSNWVYYESAYPNIRYFMDGQIYKINDWKVLVIGGAYSIDKWYRLARAPKDAKWTGWFAEEQLSQEEMDVISENLFGETDIDFVLTHTCPENWEPTDLFLRGIDQSQVDKSMERWLDKLKNQFNWRIWLFGHYHDDRLVRPGVEMFYGDVEDMESIYQRWTSGEEISWWLKKDPKYDEGV